MFVLYVNGFIQSFTKYGRYADLVLGLVVLGLAFHWHSWLAAGCAAVSLVAFATDFNGWVQRRAQAWAHSVNRRRMARR